ncbi:MULTISPECIES: type IX secretion system motor protein PorM/GldM [Prevotella]|uniref:Gliding motility protein GldM n=1 Tax=Prevotella herbatica TaxID=2801997 RepID=A0ABM7NWV7_9BACT|nr:MULTISPECIES: gliding motility protein GldM [Prevotella]MDN5552940.1 gliding motility protein GldM [Prevotella sp.]BCS84989.1 gliding motility protein GldM [Prevotella herbatica]
MAIKKRLVSPRQKMINLMYIVLMAMLALNISTEVLNGFSIVEESLNRTTDNSSKENESMYTDFASLMKKNPEKVEAWFAKAKAVKQMSDSLYNFAQELKVAIVRKADGKNGNVYNIENKDNLEAAGEVMLSPIGGKGGKLFNAINSYRNRIVGMVADPQQKKIIDSNLSTKVPRQSRLLGKNWQEYMFENMPVAASITLLSKLQSDVRYAEGEVLHTLVSNIDMKDIRVNKLSAFVIPDKTTLYPGERFSANIVMAAVDTTQQPQIYVNGQRIATRNGQYSFIAGGVGEHTFDGYILMQNRNGDVLKRNFLQKYSVIPAPNSATVAADMMNVLYAGYHNPMSVSVPGVPANAVSISMTGGSMISKGNGHFIAVPSTVGKDVTIHVTARDKGQARSLPPFIFHVRKLPDPIAYVALGTTRFKGGAMPKASLMGAHGINAAIDDGLLDIQFKVVSFETVFFDNMGNAIPIASLGSNFSDRQRDTFRSLSRNRRFYITHVKAVGPDGITRILNGALEIIVR